MLLDVACYQLQLHPNCTRVPRDWRPKLLSCFSLHCSSCQIIYQQCQRNEPCKRFVQALNLSNTCCSNPNILVVTSHHPAASHTVCVLYVWPYCFFKAFFFHSKQGGLERLSTRWDVCSSLQCLLMYSLQ